MGCSPRRAAWLDIIATGAVFLPQVGAQAHGCKQMDSHHVRLNKRLGQPLTYFIQGNLVVHVGHACIHACIHAALVAK